MHNINSHLKIVLIAFYAVVFSPIFVFATVSYDRTPSGFYVGDQGIQFHLNSDDVPVDFADCVALKLENQTDNITFPWQPSAADLYFTDTTGFKYLAYDVVYQYYQFGTDVDCSAIDFTGSLNQSVVETSGMPGDDFYIFSTFPEISGGSGTTTNIINVSTTTEQSNPQLNLLLAAFYMLAVMFFTIWLLRSQK